MIFKQEPVFLKIINALIYMYPLKNERNFGVRRVLKGDKAYIFIIMCSFLILLSNLVSLLHIGSSLPL